MERVTVITHPLVQHNLAQLRDQRTQPQEFRRLLGEIASLMIYEATRDFAVKKISVRTPLAIAPGYQLQREVVLVPVLRAGLGMHDSILQLIPHARVKDLERFEVILIDPMLATGGSSVAAVDLLKAQGAKRIRVVNLVAAPEGIRLFHKAYPQVPIFTAAVDKKLNKKGYIIPGLGDAGDRLFGT
jgi:uracil phosphoribosyltransferase